MDWNEFKQMCFPSDLIKHFPFDFMLSQQTIFMVFLQVTTVVTLPNLES